MFVNFEAQVIYMPFIDKKFYNLDEVTMKLFFITAFIAVSFVSFSQKKQSPRDYMPTENVEMKKDANKRSNRPKRDSYSYIYVPNADNILYGNPCALSVTRKMGFEYLVEPKGIKGSKNWKGKLLNNLWVKTKLIITRTPFWKVTLNSRFKECRTISGDIVG